MDTSADMCRLATLLISTTVDDQHMEVAVTIGMHGYGHVHAK